MASDHPRYATCRHWERQSWQEALGVCSAPSQLADGTPVPVMRIDDYGYLETASSHYCSLHSELGSDS